MFITITPEQRDAIYEVVMNHLTGIGDIWITVERGDFDNAQRLGRAFADDLRLLEDLGWEQQTPAAAVTLTMPRDDLTRAAVQLHARATGAVGAYVARPRRTSFSPSETLRRRRR